MKMRQLGGGLGISAIGLGSATDKQQAIAVIRSAVERGVNSLPALTHGMAIRRSLGVSTA